MKPQRITNKVSIQYFIDSIILTYPNDGLRESVQSIVDTFNSTKFMNNKLIDFNVDQLNHMINKSIGLSRNGVNKWIDKNKLDNILEETPPLELKLLYKSADDALPFEVGRYVRTYSNTFNKFYILSYKLGKTKVNYLLGRMTGIIRAGHTISFELSTNYCILHKWNASEFSKQSLFRRIFRF